MALRICRGCTTAYTVDAPCCPHCGSTDGYEQGSDATSVVPVADDEADEEDSDAEDL